MHSLWSADLRQIMFVLPWSVWRMTDCSLPCFCILANACLALFKCGHNFMSKLHILLHFSSSKYTFLILGSAFHGPPCTFGKIYKYHTFPFLSITDKMELINKYRYFSIPRQFFHWEWYLDELVLEGVHWSAIGVYSNRVNNL